jgi:large subunit ribosomal protein L24
MPRIKKGDLVQVISGGSQERGGDRGKQGRVLAVLRETNRVIVEGVNIVTKHNKVRGGERSSKLGGIETQEAPIHISNVMLIDPSSKKPTRVGIKTQQVDLGDSTKSVRVRVAKKSGKEI